MTNDNPLPEIDTDYMRLLVAVRTSEVDSFRSTLSTIPETGSIEERTYTCHVNIRDPRYPGDESKTYPIDASNKDKATVKCMNKGYEIWQQKGSDPRVVVSTWLE
jgi:hypothetical protein